MAGLINYHTKGGEVLQVANLPGSSTTPIIINEDAQIVVEIQLILNGLVYGHKVWDESIVEEKEVFTAKLLYHGRAGTPPDTIFQQGQYVLLDRVGEFNGTGLEGFELHEPNSNKVSWICLVHYNPVVFVRDNGENQAELVEYNRVTGSFEVPAYSYTAPMQTPDPVSFFHNDSPPFAKNRIYPAISEGNKFIVFLPAHGEEDKTFSQNTESGAIFTLKTDGSGHVVDFAVS